VKQHGRIVRHTAVAGMAVATALGLWLTYATPVEAQRDRRPAVIQAGPLGIAAGQFMRLNVFTPANGTGDARRLRLMMVDGVSGEELARRDVMVQPGKGAFLDYMDAQLTTGGRRCVVGMIVSPRDAASGQATGVMQVFNGETGETTVALPLGK